MKELLNYKVPKILQVPLKELEEESLKLAAFEREFSEWDKHIESIQHE